MHSPGHRAGTRKPHAQTMCGHMLKCRAGTLLLQIPLLATLPFDSITGALRPSPEEPMWFPLRRREGSQVRRQYPAVLSGLTSLLGPHSVPSNYQEGGHIMFPVLQGHSCVGLLSGMAPGSRNKQPHAPVARAAHLSVILDPCSWCAARSRSSSSGSSPKKASCRQG